MAGLRGATFAGAFAGALMLMAAPCSAQTLNLNPYGLALDPYHVFPPGPAVDPGPVPREHRRRHGRRFTRHAKHAMRGTRRHGSAQPPPG